MPTIYRPMKRDADDLPKVGTKSKELGVRVPPDAHADVDLDTADHVELNGRGMSVAKHWTALPGHLIPKRLKNVFPAAAGPNSLACFKMGDGEFADSQINNDLTLVLKPHDSRKGNVTPAVTIHIVAFQQALAATREEWRIDEELP